jgi:undecaprenyl-diphosphatase
LFEDYVEGFFENDRLVGVSLLFTAAVLLLSAAIKRRGGRVVEMGFGAALTVGVAQAVAIIPGVSRSGMTIVAGLLVGLAGPEAVAFSFLLSVPAILGATALELRKADAYAGSWPGLAWACALAFVVGLFAIYVVVRTARGRGFAWFGAYCAVVGVLALVAL